MHYATFPCPTFNTEKPLSKLASKTKPYVSIFCSNSRTKVLYPLLQVNIA